MTNSYLGRNNWPKKVDVEPRSNVAPPNVYVMLRRTMLLCSIVLNSTLGGFMLLLFAVLFLAGLVLVIPTALE